VREDGERKYWDCSQERISEDGEDQSTEGEIWRRGV